MDLNEKKRIRRQSFTCPLLGATATLVLSESVLEPIGKTYLESFDRAAP